MAPIRGWLSDQTWMTLALLFLTGGLGWLVGLTLWRARHRSSSQDRKTGRSGS